MEMKRKEKRMKGNQREAKKKDFPLRLLESFSIKTIRNSVDASIERITRNIRSISVLLPTAMKYKKTNQPPLVRSTTNEEKR
jgi:hypothetical protein